MPVSAFSLQPASLIGISHYIKSLVIKTPATDRTIVTTLNALDAEDYPEFAEITWANPSAGVLSATADTAGKPFTCTISPFESDGSTAGDAQTIEGANTPTTGTVSTASAGPNDWSTAANWSDGAVPVDTDIVWLDSTNAEILYGLDQSAVTLTALHIPSTFTGKLGLLLINEDATSYPEYRDCYLRIGATTCNIGFGEGDSSQRIKIDFGTVQTAVHVYGSSTGEGDDLEAVLLKGTHASNTVNVNRGEVGWAVLGGEVGTILTLTMGFQSNVDSDAVVRCGSGSTLGTITKTGGVLEVNSAVATLLTQLAGSTTINGTGAVAQLTIRGGSVAYNTTGTLGGNTIVAGGVLSFDADNRAKTVTNAVEAYTGGQVLDRNKVVSSLVIDFNEMDPGFGIGSNFKLTRAAVS